MPGKGHTRWHDATKLSLVRQGTGSARNSFSHNQAPPSTETCPSHLCRESVMLVPAGPTSELWAVPCLQCVVVPDRMLHSVGHPCDSAALVTSSEGRYSHVSVPTTSASAHDDIPLRLSNDFGMLPVRRWPMGHIRLMPWFALPCWVQLTMLNLLAPCPALGPGEAVMLACHLQFWRGISCSWALQLLGLCA